MELEEKLRDAAGVGNVEEIVRLLDLGADIDASDGDGGTALMMASVAGHMECVQVLLDKGADVNMQDMWGGTALMMASQAVHMECVQVLLDKGADVNMQNMTMIEDLNEVPNPPPPISQRFIKTIVTRS
eukprot:Em0013g331a